MLDKIRKVFISSSSFFYNDIRTNDSGPVIPLLNFFRYRAKKIYLLEQPLPGSDFLDIIFTVIENGEKKEETKLNFFFSNFNRLRLNSNRTYIRLKLRDIISNLYFMLKKYRELKNGKIDLYIGLECLNAICGILLKRLGLVKTVVYYIFDWAPDRYSNPIMNSLYINLDKIATYYSDYTWNITYAIADARSDLLKYNSNKMSHQLYVPYSTDFRIERIKPDKDIDTNLIIYSGALIQENGPFILLRAFKLLLEKYPQARLMVIGSGEQEQVLINYAQKHDILSKVEFTGYIPEEEKVIELQCKAAIGAAPYPLIRGTRKAFGDVIKIRMYFISGLVTVTTPVPPVSREIHEEALGKVTKGDSSEEFAEALFYLISDKKRLLKIRKNVVEKARRSNWEDNYTKALLSMGYGFDHIA